MSFLYLLLGRSQRSVGRYKFSSILHVRKHSYPHSEHNYSRQTLHSLQSLRYRFHSWQWQDFFLKSPDLVCRQPVTSPQGYGGRGIKLTIRLHSTARWRMCGAVSPLPLTLPWHSTQTQKTSLQPLFSTQTYGGRWNSAAFGQNLCWLHCFSFHSWYLSFRSKSSVDIIPGDGP